MKRLIFLLLLVLSFESAFLKAESSHALPKTQFLQSVATAIKKYKRYITVLEIAGTIPTYTPFISTTYNTVNVVMLVKGGAQEYAHKIKQAKYSNITVLAPYEITLESLTALGRCEHFDVVIVHDIHNLIKADAKKLIESYSKLGDQLFIETSTSAFEQQLQNSGMKQITRISDYAFYSFSRPKGGLDIARFTQKDKPMSIQPRYQIESTPDHKFFNKKGLEEPTRYIDGINLVTFVMLKGIYPEDVSIRKQLSAMNKKYGNHNDLVLGNIVVQGNKLLPIDFNDKRRDADVQYCITAALKAFKTGNTRQRNPERWMQEYYDSF